MIGTITYPGSKGCAYQRTISLMPQHATYMETHMGGGSVLRYKRPARRSIGIDTDLGVVERWRSAGLAGLQVVHGSAATFESFYGVVEN
jgi:DNA adenine methylase